MPAALLLTLAWLAVGAHANDACTPGPSYDRRRCEEGVGLRELRTGAGGGSKCRAGEPGCKLDTLKPNTPSDRTASSSDGSGEPSGAQSAASPEGAGSEAGPAVAAAAPAVDQRRTAAAANRAGKMAEGMMKDLRSVEDVPESGPGPAGAGARPGADKPRTAEGFTTPQNKQDLLLAGAAGFAGSFESLGLKSGTGPSGAADILRADGTPAQQPELDALAARIAAEPLALMRRPDFFNILPREGFGALKRELGTRPTASDGALKDLELSETKRDILHARSCSRLSGDCNKHSKAPSYRRGDYVPPEDLNAIWDEIRAEAEDPDSAFNKVASETPTRAAAPPPELKTRGLADKLRGILGRFSGLFSAGGDVHGGAGSPVGETPPAAGGAAQPLPSASPTASAIAVVQTPSQRSAAPATIGITVPAAGGREAQVGHSDRLPSRGALGAAAGGALLLLVLLWLRPRGEA